MEKMSEQELQELLAKGLQPANETSGAKAYQALFSELKKEPENGLPYNFSAKVTAQIRLQQDLKLGFKPYLITLIVTVAAIFAALILAPLFPQQFSPAFLSAMTAYKWPVLFVITGFILVKYFDQQLLYQKLVKRQEG